MASRKRVGRPGVSNQPDGAAPSSGAPGWDYVKALALARKRITAASKVDVPTYAGAAKNPVERARRSAEAAAPALIDLTQALTLGSDPDELDRRRGGVKIM